MKSFTAFVLEDMKSASDWARELAALRDVKPRPIDKLFGTNGPTPAQKAKWDDDMRDWNAKYRKASAEQKKALERDNASFRARAVTEDEVAGAPANAAGSGNIAGLGVGKAGKPANWGEPGVNLRKKQQDEAGSDFDYTNDIVTELVQEGLLESTTPSDTFAGAAVFEVDMDKVMKSRFGKNRYHRYSRYVGEDEVGEAIRQHGRSRKSGDIILKDSKTAVMTYLRRKQTVG